MEESVYDLGVKDGLHVLGHKNGKLKTEDYYNHGSTLDTVSEMVGKWSIGVSKEI